MRGLDNSQEYTNYKKARNKLNRDISKAKDTYLRQKLEDNMDDPRKMWGVLNESLKVSKKKKVSPDYVEITDPKTQTTIKIHDKKTIADEMNTHFSSVGSKLASKLKPTSTNFKSYLNNRNPKSIFFENAEHIEIHNLIVDLNARKSVGVDGISALMLKWAAPILIPYLTCVFNQCLSEGIYPSALKKARVTPIFKGGKNNENSSYRPISILTQLNRIF